MYRPVSELVGYILPKARGPSTKRPWRSWRGAGGGFLRPEGFGKGVEGLLVGIVCGGARPEKGETAGPPRMVIADEMSGVARG
jgi:hypothetical protein